MEEKLYIVEADGRKRPAVKAICEHCEKEYLRPRRFADRKYCNLDCLRAAKPKQVVSVECTTCKKRFDREPRFLNRSKSGLQFCSRECKEKAQSLEGGCKAIQPSHYNSLNTYKALAKPLIRNGCVDCGETIPYYLMVHHIDGDRSNNVIENLECVCANHHILRHLKESKGVWGYVSSAITPRELINTGFFYQKLEDE